MGQRELAERLIAQRLPGLAANASVFEALLRYFGDTPAIPTDLSDLKEFLAGDSLYRVIRVTGESLRECAITLVDQHPECTGARGMLRYYEAGPDFLWAECEAAETLLGDALTLDVYEWQPDSFTLFTVPSPGARALVAILAFA